MNPKTLSVLALAIAALTLTACGEKKAETNTPKAAVAPSLELSANDVFTVAESTIQAGVTITGQLDALNHTTVQAQVGSNVSKVLVRGGEIGRAHV